jgi:transposase
MRGDHQDQQTLFSTRLMHDRIPMSHPIRKVRVIVDTVLRQLDDRFSAMYSKVGRPSIPPEHLLRALLLQILFSIRSERQLMEQMDYNLLYRWFVGLDIDSTVWDASTFSQNRDRLLQHDIGRAFFEEVLAVARTQELLSADHFSVDGTLLTAWGSMKSVKPIDGSGPNDPPGRNPSVDFKGQERRNDTHQSTSDPEARMYRKGNTGAVLCHLGHALMENRSGLVVDVAVTEANGHAERQAALVMAKRAIQGKAGTLGADKGYDTRDFVAALKEQAIKPHIARNTGGGRRSAVDGRTARGKGYAMSQKIRKRIEEFFGWAKTIGGMRKSRFIGRERTGLAFTLVAGAYNLVRMMSIFGWKELPA